MKFGFGKKSEGEPNAATPGDQSAPQDPSKSEGGAVPTPPPSTDKQTISSQQASEQIKRESKKLNLVGNAQLGSAIAEAVRQGLEKHFLFEEEQLKAAVDTIGRVLFQQLKAQSKAVRGLPKKAFLREVEEDKRKIVEQGERARKELDGLLQQLQDRNGEVTRMQADLVRESQENAEVEDRAIAGHIAQLFEGCKTPEDYERIREQITLLTLDSLQGERDKSIEAQLAEQKREVEQYKRRISKLTNSLELTEEELKRIAAAKSIDLGVQSIYRTVQGLGSDDDDYETKKELMSCIFQANLDLQKNRTAG
jgi:hypothetical protein